MNKLSFLNEEGQLYGFLNISQKPDWYKKKKVNRILLSGAISGSIIVLCNFLSALKYSENGIITMTSDQLGSQFLYLIFGMIIFIYPLYWIYTNSIAYPIWKHNSFELIKDYLKCMIGTKDAPIIVQFPDGCERNRFYSVSSSKNLLPAQPTKKKSCSFRTMLVLQYEDDRVHLLFSESYLTLAEISDRKSTLCCQYIVDVKIDDIQNGEKNDELILLLSSIDGENLGKLKINIGLEHRKYLSNRLHDIRLLTKSESISN